MCSNHWRLDREVEMACSAKMGQDGELEVSGDDHSQVLLVSKELFKELVEQRAKVLAEERMEMAERRAQRRRLTSPWISGSFYLSCLLAVIATLLVISKALPILVLPIVVVASLLLVTVIGAFQQSQDGKLSNKTFLALMLGTFRNLPLVATRRSGLSDES
jgi:Flp pilus assembly protein TadB